jgi:hypothetical protein
MAAMRSASLQKENDYYEKLCFAFAFRLCSQEAILRCETVRGSSKLAFKVFEERSESSLTSGCKGSQCTPRSMRGQNLGVVDPN